MPVGSASKASQWYDSETVFPTGDDLIALFWKARVPGSGTPEIPYVEMVKSMANKGYEMSAAEALLPEGLRLANEKDRPALRMLHRPLVGCHPFRSPRPCFPILAVRASRRVG